jgi:hypothetical protein
VSDVAGAPAARPSFLWWLLPLTVLYLIFELSFSARLLDLTGGLANRDELRAIEFAGKTLSGCALGLFLIGTPLMPLARRQRWRRDNVLVAVVLTGVAAIVTAHVVEQAIIDHVVERSAGEERRVAVLATSLREAILEDIVVIADLGVTAETAQTPEGKTMLAVLPLMATKVADLEVRLAPFMLQIVGERIRREFGPERFHNDVYIPSLVELANVYALVPQTMDFADFLGRPEVQQRWKRSIAIEFDDIELPYALDPEDIRRLVYEPLIERRATAQSVRLLSPPQSYQDGGALEELGRRAMESVIVPPIALAFSLIGGVTLMGKTIVYLLTLISIRRTVRWTVLAAIFAAAVWLPFQASDAITTSPTFAALYQRSERILGSVGARALVWTIRFEGFAYPFNDAVRRRVLRGIDFGYAG